MQCNHCQDESRCERMGICQAFRLLPRVEPLPAQAEPVAWEPSEAQITAALEAGCWFDTPQSRKDVRKALLAAAGITPAGQEWMWPNGIAGAPAEWASKDMSILIYHLRHDTHFDADLIERMLAFAQRAAAGAPSALDQPPSPGQQWKCGDEDGVLAPQEPKGNRCGCNHWTTRKCPARDCPWQGKRPVDAGVDLPDGAKNG